MTRCKSTFDHKTVADQQWNPTPDRVSKPLTMAPKITVQFLQTSLLVNSRKPGSDALSRLTQAPDEEGKAESSHNSRTIKIIHQLLIGGSIHRRRASTQSVLSVMSVGLCRRLETHTQREPDEQMMTISHRRSLFIFRGFLGSLSSHPTTNSSPSAASPGWLDLSSASSSTVWQLYLSFRDQLRSMVEDVVRCSFCDRSLFVATDALMGAKVLSDSSPCCVSFPRASSVLFSLDESSSTGDSGFSVVVTESVC